MAKIKDKVAGANPNLGGTAEIERNSSLSSMCWAGIFVLAKMLFIINMSKIEVVELGNPKSLHLI